MGVRIYTTSSDEANWFIKERDYIINGVIGYVFNQFVDDPERSVPQFAAGGVQSAIIRTKSGGASW